MTQNSTSAPTRFQRLVDIVSNIDAAKTASLPMVELQALSLVSTLVNSWRILIAESPFKKSFPSTLTLIEAPTGSGKNAPYRFMQNHLFGVSFRYLEDLLFTQECEARETFKTKVERDNPLTGDEKVDQKIEKKREGIMTAYDSNKRPLGVFTAEDGSFEGFAFGRAYLEKFRFGAPTVRVEEYGDKLLLMRRAAHLLSFYNKLLELVDYDELMAKSVKSQEGATPGSSGMGITLYFTLSDPDPSQRDEIRRAVLKSVGRRGFLLRETNQTIRLRSITPPSVEDVDALGSEIFSLTETLSARFVSEAREIPLTNEAAYWYAQLSARYAAELDDFRQNKAPGTLKDIRCALLADLDRKILRVGALLAVFNHGAEDLRITRFDLEQAEELVQKTLQNAQNFFDLSDHNSVNEILSILQEKGEAGCSALDLLGLKAFWGLPKRNFQTYVYDVLMNDVRAEARKLGLEVEHFKERKRDFFRVRLLTADDEFLHQTSVPSHTDTGSCAIGSVKDGINLADSTGFTPVNTLDEITAALESECQYSATVFRGGKRDVSHFISAGLIILDYDEGVTIGEVEELFKDYTYILATTTHHQKPKGSKPACDRFRVILTPDYTFTDPAVYRRFMEHVTLRFKSDPSCKDAARTYKGVAGATVLRHSGRKFPAALLVNQIESEYQRQLLEKPKVIVKTPAIETVASNEIPSFQLIDSRGAIHDAKTFIGALEVSDSVTVPIKCPFPNHSDTHASAFASHRSNGGLQVSCVVCGLTKFITP